MKKSNSFKAIVLLVELFLNNALNGLLKHPILAKKKIRLLIFSSLLVIYLAYFFYNMKELARISPDTSQMSNSLINTGRKVTFYSFFSNTFVLGVVIYILIDNTVALDKTSLFFVKTLPFKKRDVHTAYLLFKFIIMFLLYELVMIIATPAIKLVASYPLEYLAFFITQHLFYLIIIGLIELMTTLAYFLLRLVPRALHVFKVVYDSLLMIFSILYFFDLRYEFELFLAKKCSNISYFIFLALFMTILCVIFIGFCLLTMPTLDRITNNSKFIKLPLLEKVVFRYKANWYFISFALLIIVVITFQSGIKTMLSILPFILSFSGILLISYADITADFRKQYDILRIKIWAEWLNQILLIVLFISPLVILYFMNFGGMQQIILSFSLASAALILGYLFPKSQGSLNETTSVVLLFVVFILISLAINNLAKGWITLSIFSTIHYMIIRKVRNEKQ